MINRYHKSKSNKMKKSLEILSVKKALNLISTILLLTIKGSSGKAQILTRTLSVVKSHKMLTIRLSKIGPNSTVSKYKDQVISEMSRFQCILLINRMSLRVGNRDQA